MFKKKDKEKGNKTKEEAPVKIEKPAKDVEKKTKKPLPLGDLSQVEKRLLERYCEKGWLSHQRLEQELSQSLRDMASFGTRVKVEVPYEETK